MGFEDAGINKAVGNLFQNISRKWFYNSIQFFIRYSGFFLLLTIFYFHFAFNSLTNKNGELLFWIGSYLIYLFFLEILRSRRINFYDSEWFISTRVVVNILFVSWLLFASPSGRYILSFAYMISYILTIIYYPKRYRLIISVYILSIIGLIFSCSIFDQETPLYDWQILLISIVLLSSLLITHQIYVVISNISDEISEVSKSLQEIHSINEVVNEIAKRANTIPGAENIFVLIIEPEKQSYIWHTLIGLNLKSKVSMEDIINQCKVLKNGKSYQHDDIAGTVDESYFEQFFSPPPRSILVEPIYGLDTKILGLILVGNSKPAQFDSLNKRFFKQICSSASLVVESCLLRIKAKSEIVSNKPILEKLLRAEKEADVIKILIKQSVKEVSNADGCVIHYFNSQSNNLIPVAGIKDGVMEVWEENPTEHEQQIKSIMKAGIGIAGQALLKREIVYAPDVTTHPWFEGSTKTTNLISLISIPIIELGDNILIGTLSLYSKEKDAFTFSDQTVLASLVHQGGISISNLREFEKWRLTGGPIKKIFESVLNINYEDNENILHNKLAEIGKNILPFGTVRIRVLDLLTNNLVTVGIAGYPDKDQTKLLNDKLPHDLLLEFLHEDYRVERSYLIPSDTPHWKEFADKYLYVPQNIISEAWDKYDALFTPIISRENRVLGYISWDQPKDNSRPPKRTIEALGAFATMVAWSIDLMRARHSIQEQNRLITSLITSTTEHLSTTRDPKATGEVAVKIASDLLNVEGCSLYIAKGKELVLEYSTFLKNTDLIGQRRPIQAIPGGGLTSWSASTMELLCFKTQTEYQQHLAWTGNTEQIKYLRSKKCDNLLIVPILGQSKKILGVITFENKLLNTKDGFSEIDINTAKHLAEQIGIALPLAEQFASLKSKAEEVLEDDLHELKNVFQYGIRAHSQAALQWLEKQDLNNVLDELLMLDRSAVTILDELYSLHNTMQKRYYEVENFKDALSLLTNNLLTRYSRSRLHNMSNIIIDCPHDIHIPVSFRYVLMRIASGALMNAISHSGFLENPSVQVGVKLQKEQGYLIMTIYDTGSGVNKIKAGYGIKRMKFLVGSLRDRGLDIKLRILPTPGKGVEVKLISKNELLEA